MINNRDTKFQGFAKLLADELYDALDGIDPPGVDFPDGHAVLWSSTVEPIIARRAYDLALHTLLEVGSLRVNYIYSGEELVEYCENKLTDVSDMTEWPEEDNNEVRQ